MLNHDKADIVPQTTIAQKKIRLQNSFFGQVWLDRFRTSFSSSIKLLAFVENLKLKLLTTSILILAGIVPAIFIILIFNKQQKNLRDFDVEIKKFDDKISMPIQANSGSSLSIEKKMQLEKEILEIKKDQINSINSTYSNVVQNFNGILILFTALGALFNIKIALGNLKASQDKQITDRFATALGQLDSTNPTIQLGAIYSFERIAKESEQDFRNIMEILTSFIRTSSQKNDLNQNDYSRIIRQTDVALKVIAKLLSSSLVDKKNSQTVVDMSNSILNKANMVNLFLAGVNLEKSELKYTNMDGVDLSKANLTDSNLIGAYFGDANFTDVLLNKAVLNDANTIRNNQPVKQATFKDAKLREAKINGAQFSKSNFTGADLHSASITGTYLREANFRGAILTMADLSGSDLSGASLREAILVNTIFDQETDIYNTDFTKATISNLENIKKAKNWRTANYDIEISIKLGLKKPEINS